MAVRWLKNWLINEKAIASNGREREKGVANVTLKFFVPSVAGQKNYSLHLVFLFCFFFYFMSTNREHKFHLTQHSSSDCVRVHHRFQYIKTISCMPIRTNCQFSLIWATSNTSLFNVCHFCHFNFSANMFSAKLWVKIHFSPAVSCIHRCSLHFHCLFPHCPDECNSHCFSLPLFVALHREQLLFLGLLAVATFTLAQDYDGDDDGDGKCHCRGEDHFYQNDTCEVPASVAE